MFNNKFVPILVSLSLLSTTAMAVNVPVQVPAFTVTKINSITNSSSPQDFNLIIKFVIPNSTQPIRAWDFGFYMPRTFNHSASVNPNMTMTLSNANQGSVNLVFVAKPKNQTKLVYGTGYSNVLKPALPSYELIPGQTYTLTVTNSNQWAPGNLSSMPQNFFIFNVQMKQFVKGIASVMAYGATIGNIQNLTGIGGYNFSQVKQDIAKHNKTNWQSSAPKNAAMGGDVNQETITLANKYQLIPTPQSIVPNYNASGVSLSKQVVLFSQFGDENLHPLQQEFKSGLHVQLSYGSKQQANIVVEQDSSISNPEGYELITAVTKNTSHPQIVIKASTATGAFYGMQTLMMLMHHDMQLPALTINDAPRFKYRGMLLDVARVYYPIKAIEKLVNLMAAQKLNTLHIHFSDDEGWRLALPVLTVSGPNTLRDLGTRGYVKGLTTPAAVNTQANLDETNYARFKPTMNGPLVKQSYPVAYKPYARVYTATEIKQLIHYANVRHITIIPEIDMPGHARALVHALPNIFEDPNDHSQYISVQGYYDDVLPVCLYHVNKSKQGKKFTQTVNKMMQQISQLFAGQTTLYANSNEVSVGGDEVSAAAWSQDSSCNRAVWQGLNAIQKSQYFFEQLAQANSNIQFSGWQQFVMNDDNTMGTYVVPAKQAGHVYVWTAANITQNGKTVPGGASTGIGAAQQLAKANYPVVLAFADDDYFDLTYTPNAWEPGFYWASQYIDTHSALYSAVDADAVLAGLNTQTEKNVLGIEGALWGDDYINARHMGYKVLPRLSGLSEASWAQSEYTDQNSHVDWKSLVVRLGSNNNRGVLGFLSQVSGLKYRGYPNGMQMAIPVSLTQ